MMGGRTTYIFLNFTFVAVYLGRFKQCFPMEGNLVPEGHLAMSTDIFHPCNWESRGRGAISIRG